MRLIKTQIKALLLILALTATFFIPTNPAHAQTTATRDANMEAGFLASLNAERAARGVAPLTLNGSMSNAAQNWTTQMVNGEFLAHASDIITGTPAGWNKVGENVGRGKTVTSLTQSFMNSPGHARNILDPDYTHIGISVYIHPTGKVYTTHRFAALPTTTQQPAPTTPPPTAVPAPQPTAIPAPQPTAIPAPAAPAPQPTPAPAAPTTPEPAPAAPTTPEPAPAAPATPEQLAYTDTTNTDTTNTDTADTDLARTTKEQLKLRRQTHAA